MTTVSKTTFGTYTLPEFNWPRLLEEVERLNRRALKLGLTPIVTSTIKDEWRPRPGQAGVTDRWITAELVGDAPIISGYQFAATIVHEMNGNAIINLMSGFHAQIPPAYKGTGPWCDHCKTKRQRTDTYLVYHTEHGFKQVGSSCMKDFLGHKSPHAIAAWLEDIHALTERLSDETGEYGGVTHRAVEFLDTRQVVATAAAIIRTYGWVSRATSREKGGPATADYVHDYLLSQGQYADRVRSEVSISDADVAKAINVIDFVRDELSERPGLDDYHSNLVIALSGDQMNVRNIALATSAVPVFWREEKQRATTQTATGAASSQWIGEKEQRYDFTLKVTRFDHKPREDGSFMHIVWLVDPTGNFFKWFASNPPAKWEKEPDGAGRWWLVRATVKDHTEWNGKKETLLTRCQVLKEVK